MVQREQHGAGGYKEVRKKIVRKINEMKVKMTEEIRSKDQGPLKRKKRCVELKY